MKLFSIKNRIDNIRIECLGFDVSIPYNYKKACTNNYRKRLKKLRQKFGKQKLKIGFLVWENSKWSYEYVYPKFAEDTHFEPYVLLVDNHINVIDIPQNKQFFKKFRTQIVKTARDIKEGGFDILFYEQPWYALHGEFAPLRLSKYALTYYEPYGIEFDNGQDFMKECELFNRSIYKYFIFNTQTAPDFYRYGVNNVVAVGHSRLDAYFAPTAKHNSWKSQNKTHIIYAPHHSFKDSIYKQGTWEWNGEHILELAKQHQDTTEWIFKPHPRFKIELTNLLHSAEKAQAIFDEWGKVATVYTEGNYMDIFKTADLMISDCCSFKIEWLPTEKPYIELVSHYPNADLGDMYRHFCEGYYKARTTEDIDKFFDQIVYQKQDPYKQKRQELLKEIPQQSSLNIYNHICQELAQS